MFPYAYKLKNKFHFEEEGIGNIFLWDFRSSYSRQCSGTVTLLIAVSHV